MCGPRAGHKPAGTNLQKNSFLCYTVSEIVCGCSCSFDVVLCGEFWASCGTAAKLIRPLLIALVFVQTSSVV